MVSIPPHDRSLPSIRIISLLLLVLLVFSSPLSLIQATTPTVEDKGISHKATFRFENEGGLLKMVMELETVDLHQIFADEGECDPEKSLGICVNWYVNQHLKCIVNEGKAELLFKGVKSVEGISQAEFHFNVFVDQIRTLKVWTDCFLPLHKRWINAVVFTFGEFEKTYSLTAKEKSVIARF